MIVPFTTRTANVRADAGSPERGFSLVEVILALGLLAFALVSIASLSVLGSRQLRSGRASTAALAVARSILEEMEGWGFRQTYEGLGLDGAAPIYSVDSRVNPAASSWQQDLEAALGGGHAEIDLASVEPGQAPPPMNRARAIRVLVTVRWSEGVRRRAVQLATVRI